MPVVSFRSNYPNDEMVLLHSIGLSTDFCWLNRYRALLIYSFWASQLGLSKSSKTYKLIVAEINVGSIRLDLPWRVYSRRLHLFLNNRVVQFYLVVTWLRVKAILSWTWTSIVQIEVFIHPDFFSQLEFLSERYLLHNLAINRGFFRHLQFTTIRIFSTEWFYLIF